MEITGPAERKMIINALNSGAKVFMADFEDSLSPTWEGTIQGQINLRDAVNRNDHFFRLLRANSTRCRRRPQRCLCARAAGICRRSMS